MSANTGKVDAGGGPAYGISVEQAEGAPTMSMLHSSEITWRKSSYSGNEDSYCVEVADLAHVTGVRDSQDRGHPGLSFTPGRWATFLSAVKSGSIGPA